MQDLLTYIYWYAPSNFLKLIRCQKINHSLLLLLNKTIVHFNTASYKTPDKRIPIDRHSSNQAKLHSGVNQFLYLSRTYRQVLVTQDLNIHIASSSYFTKNLEKSKDSKNSPQWTLFAPVSRPSIEWAEPLE